MDFDLDTLDKAVEFASRSTKAADSAFGIARKVKKLFSSEEPEGKKELEGLVMELMNDVTDTKLANLDLKEQLIELREKAIQSNTREKEFDRYELWEAPAGSLIYRLKDTDDQKEPNHYLCPRCKEDGVKSVLQGHSTFRDCPRCDAGFPISRDEGPTIANSTSGWGV